jgi:hypothetical protein
VAAFLFRAFTKLKILLTLWGFLPLLGGCTAEQMADFKAGYERGEAAATLHATGLRIMVFLVAMGIAPSQSETD